MSNESKTGSPAPALEGLLQLAREQATGEVSEEQHQQDKERMLRKLGEPAKERRPGWGLRVALAALCLSAVALLLVAESRPQPKPLAFSVQRAHIDDAQVVGGGFAHARLRAKNTPVTLAFEEGSRIVLAPGSSGRLVQVGPHGAELELALGQAQVEITPRPKARWLLHAGPYVVRVTGTAFSLRWEPERDTFEVVMQHGSVLVSGGVAAEGVALSAGQRLTVVGQELRLARTSEADGAADIAANGDANANGTGTTGANADATGTDSSETDGAGQTDKPDDTAPPAAPTSSTSGDVASNSPSAKPAPSSWTQRVARGEFDKVVAEADARGVTAVLAQASLPDLVALADAARYAGRGALAKQALQAQRKRFAGSSAARAAAFLLGRMADSAGQSGQALRHYQSYLAEGGGPLSREALGRAMLAAQRSGAHAQAAQLARSYLKQHPQGPHASSARRLLRKDKDGAMP